MQLFSQRQMSRRIWLCLLLSLIVHSPFILKAVRLLPSITKQPENSGAIMVSLMPPALQKATLSQGTRTTLAASIAQKNESTPPQSKRTLPAPPLLADNNQLAEQSKKNTIERSVQPASSQQQDKAREAGSRPGTTAAINQTSHPGPVSATEKAQPPEVAFGSLQGPSFRKQVQPVYPTVANRRGRTGRVLLRLSITETGQLTRVEVLDDPGHGFAEAALEAVRQSSFVPAHHNGKPIAVRTILPIRFKLPR